MVISLDLLCEELKRVRRGKLVVLATGVFDLLHEEHREFLRWAKESGEILMVGVESDRRVRELKGKDRPVWNEGRRVTEVANLEWVDWAFVLPEKFDSDADYESLVVRLAPDIYAVSEHSPFMENKVRIMEKCGGVVRVVHAWNPEISTTKLLARRAS